MPAPKQKPCTLAPKHSWEHVKNVTFQTITHGPRGSSAHIRYRGKYKCACGEIKYGASK